MRFPDTHDLTPWLQILQSEWERILTITLLIITSIVFLLGLQTGYRNWIFIHTPLKTTSLTVQTNLPSDTIILDAHLFGQSAEALGHVPISSLQLRVTGIVDEKADPNQSKAYISREGSPSQIYKIGDELNDGITIYSIEAGAVILQRDGELEQLPLPRPPLIFKPPVKELP